LKRAAVEGAPGRDSDGTGEYQATRKRQRELLHLEWTNEDCDQAEKEEGLPLEEIVREVDLPAQVAKPSSGDEDAVLLRPTGPGWVQAGTMTATPWKGQWFVHERQEQGTGKHHPWLWFDARTGGYYIRSDSAASGYVAATPPNAPDVYGVVFRGGSSYLPPTEAPARKDDVQVVLQDLPKTGFLLKSPLVFLDKPAAFFAVFDGLRDNGAAADFCARNFHKHLLPRLSLRHTAWEDFELADVLSETFSALDKALLSSQAQYEGCSVAVALLVGNRVATAAIGGASVLLVRKGEEPAAYHSACALTPRGSRENREERGLCGGRQGGHLLAVASAGRPAGGDHKNKMRDPQLCGVGVDSGGPCGDQGHEGRPQEFQEDVIADPP